MSIAQVHLEDPRTGERFAPGDKLPAGFPGIKALTEQGAVGAKAPVIQIGSGDVGHSKEKKA